MSPAITKQRPMLLWLVAGVEFFSVVIYWPMTADQEINRVILLEMVDIMRHRILVMGIAGLWTI